MSAHGRPLPEKRELLRRVGHMSQAGGAVPLRLAGGKADGVEAVWVRTGTGFQFMALPGRGMDIAWADYNGHALGFLSKTGVVHPAYYDQWDDGFHRSFFAGLLTTCGLRNTGAPCLENGERFGLHGRISHIPAADVCVSNSWVEGRYISTVSGKMTESKLYGENLTLTRRITTVLGESAFTLTDIVENDSFHPEEIPLLYHFNFGWPLLDTATQLRLPPHTTMPRDAVAAAQDPAVFPEPADDFPETVFYHHDLVPESDGLCRVGLYNPHLENSGIGARICYDPARLPVLAEWKNTRSGDNVVALEPANCYPEGKVNSRARRAHQVLAPGARMEITLRFEVFTGAQV